MINRILPGSITGFSMMAFDDARIWSTATAQARQLLMDMNLNSNERRIKLTKVISDRYSPTGHEGGIFLAATAMLSAKIGG